MKPYDIVESAYRKYFNKRILARACTFAGAFETLLAFILKANTIGFVSLFVLIVAVVLFIYIDDRTEELKRTKSLMLETLTDDDHISKSEIPAWLQIETKKPGK